MTRAGDVTHFSQETGRKCSKRGFDRGENSRRWPMIGIAASTSGQVYAHDSGIAPILAARIDDRTGRRLRGVDSARRVPLARGGGVEPRDSRAHGGRGRRTTRHDAPALAELAA